MGMVVHVQVFHGGVPISDATFDSGAQRTIKIGRLPSAQLKVDDPSVARIHAVMEFAKGGASLIDMGSTQGTLVNGERIQKQKLNHGDRIHVGDTELVVGFGAPGAAAVAPPAAQVPAAVPPMVQGTPVGVPPQGYPAQTPQMTPTAPMPGVGQVPPAQSMVGAPQAAPPPATATQPGLNMPHFPGGPGQQAGHSPMAETGSPNQPRFDPGSTGITPIKRITKDRLRSAAVESRPHPALAPEEPVTDDNRLLELRVYWGEILLYINHYNRAKRITIGENKKTDVFISSEGLPAEEFPLVRYMDGQYVLTFSERMEGEVELPTEGLRSLQEMRGSALARKDSDMEGSYCLALPKDSRVILHWGGATFAMRFVPPTKPIPHSFMKNLDLQYLNMLLLSIFLHVGLVTMLVLYPRDTTSLRDDLFDNPDRFAQLILKPQVKKKSAKEIYDKIKKKVEKKTAENKEKLKVADKRPQPTKSTQQRAAEVKQMFRQVLGGGGGGGLLGGGSGGTVSGSLANVIGTTGAGSGGLAGLGIRGGVSTGGGVGTSRSAGGIGTLGRLGGGSSAFGSGIGIGRRKERSMITLSTPVVMGALPKEVIQKVINQNKAQVRFCYERELARDQNLEGKIKLKWIIGGTGSVVKVDVTESTLDNSRVERCIQQKIRGWKFPSPAGGGIVEVNYPFVFKAS